MIVDSVLLKNTIKRLSEYHDAVELVEILEIEAYELLEAFEDKVIYNLSKFEEEELEDDFC